MPTSLLISPDNQIEQSLQALLQGQQPAVDLQRYAGIHDELLTENFPWTSYDALLISQQLLNGRDQTLLEAAKRANPRLLVIGLPDNGQDGSQNIDFRADLSDSGLVQLGQLLRPLPAEQTGEDISTLSFGGHIILKPLGRGGMSTVWLARDPASTNLRAIKVMNRRRTDSQATLDRFVQEFRLLSPLNSPYIIRAFEQDTSDDRAWLAIEFFPAGTLEQRIRLGIETHQAIKWLYEMALGLQYLHERKIIHRDLKPSNVMFRDDGSLALTDFGAAKVLSAHDLEKTPAGEVFGSPYYISPERAKGLPSDYGSDLYSLGVILFEMLTGEKPYTGESSREIFTQHIRSPLPQLPASTTLYQPLIDRLMAKRSENRCNSADELIYMIDTYWPQD